MKTVCYNWVEIPEREWQFGTSRLRDGNIREDLKEDVCGLAEDSTQACEDQCKKS